MPLAVTLKILSYVRLTRCSFWSSWGYFIQLNPTFTDQDILKIMIMAVLHRKKIYFEWIMIYQVIILIWNISRFLSCFENLHIFSGSGQLLRTSVNNTSTVLYLNIWKPLFYLFFNVLLFFPHLIRFCFSDYLQEHLRRTAIFSYLYLPNKWWFSVHNCILTITYTTFWLCYTQANNLQRHRPYKKLTQSLIKESSIDSMWAKLKICVMNMLIESNYLHYTKTTNP